MWAAVAAALAMTHLRAPIVIAAREVQFDYGKAPRSEDT
jgi:hypothetical protein